MELPQTPPATLGIRAGQSTEADEAPPQVDERTSPFISIKTAATRLKVSDKHVLRALQAGDIPGIKFGTTYRVLEAFIDHLIAQVELGSMVIVDEFAADWAAKTGEGAA